MWILGICSLCALALSFDARAQQRPYIGFVYPAGGRQGTTFEVKLGGQNLENANAVFVTGPGVTAKVREYHRALGPQEITLLNEQLKELKRSTNAAATVPDSDTMTMMSSDQDPIREPGSGLTPVSVSQAQELIGRIEKRIAQSVNRPASVALANIVYVEVTLAPDAAPGQRELRLGTLRGISNPLFFHVGQLPEFSRKPMVTAPYQVLGKEELALRKRPAEEAEDRVTVPCTVNGQIASGEVNRHRFAARKGQRLVITTQARQLIPYIADAVPGWFQPVITLCDDAGKEVAYDDDYRFKPDPTLFYEVPKDGEFVLAVCDAIYRGREDFVYRVTIGEIPFVTSIFPLGARTNSPVTLKMKGWNLGSSVLASPPSGSGPGVYALAATNHGLVSNPVLFALDSLPESFDKEPNNTVEKAQKVTLPVVVNGRMDRPDDWDVFRFPGKSNDTVVAEVTARRLDSPLDSVLKLTDANGKLLAFSDDCEDLGSGLNTHHADSRLMATLPADGTYVVHLGDTARNAGEEYAYRLRLSAPQPDFALRLVPSSVALRGKGSAAVNAHLIRKDGFTGPIKLSLKDPPKGFSAAAVSLSGTQTVARLTLRTDLPATQEPVDLRVVGSATIQGQEVTREAVPAEDRMQAFFWRHLVPASEFKVSVYDPNYQPPPKRVARPRPAREPEPKTELASTNSVANKPKFSKQQVAGRLRQLKSLYEEGLLTDDFNDEKIAECEAAQ